MRKPRRAGFVLYMQLLRSWLCPEGLAGQQFPVSALLLPDLQDANLGAGELTVGFAFGHPRMARNRIAAHDCDGVIGQGDRFDDRLSGHDAIDEFGLILHPTIRMPVAQLIGAKGLQLALILTKNRLSQRLDGLGNRRLVGGCGYRRGTPQQAQTAECKRTRNGQMTTCDAHIPSLPRGICSDKRTASCFLSLTIGPPAFPSRPSRDHCSRELLKFYPTPFRDACPAPAYWSDRLAGGADRLRWYKCAAQTGRIRPGKKAVLSDVDR